MANIASINQIHWLARYYFGRAAFSLAWVAAILTVGQQVPALSAALLVIYPAWDAAANYLDANHNGGLGDNRTQAINVAVSTITALAVLVALGMSLNAVLTVFGAWAILAGLLQLSTAVRRWKSAGAQWAMVLSGAQSALAGAVFVFQSLQTVPAIAPTLAGYAAFGAIYFLVSAIALLFSKRTPQSA
ncbi:DUF308 domain-containing protein [Mesorhizobium sp. CAU 1741]|uniref:DUF308 domain-containing protein n=1 Tax=Mesorhizobium sp. CAU 1741 TaxID=3140366 RepID=UPI00325AF852